MLKFFLGRLNNSSIIMEKVKKQIKLADVSYENVVNMGIQQNTFSINNTMKTLAVIQVMV